ncbi:MAG: heme-binding protein [Acidobacteriia bacterium]|nr:heme-binding protein [Terriglobia bacterium]
MKSLNKIAMVSAVAILVTATLSLGQIADRKTLTLDGARKVIAASMAEAKRLNAPGGVIAVVDEGGNLMALERIDNTFAAGARISIGKARTAVLFKHPTRAFEEIIKNGRTAMIALDDFTPLQGGIPIVYEGQVIGGVGVSGASSAQQDEELAIAGASVFKEAATASLRSQSPPVSYFEKNMVDDAFAKGAVLFKDSDKYMVHASRRENAGMAEVHTKDADIIYVLDGTATFVTGGSVVEEKTIAPDEIRGKEISGGETRKLNKGDVIIVPAGTPHWFKEVTNPFLYYVVKAR